MWLQKGVESVGSVFHSYMEWKGDWEDFDKYIQENVDEVHEESGSGSGEVSGEPLQEEEA